MDPIGTRKCAPRHSFLALVALFLASCGGGGGDDSAPPPTPTSPSPSKTEAAPGIGASITSFPRTLGSTTNTTASVQVVHRSTGAPLTGAVVTVNGTNLAYDSAALRYRGSLNIDPGAALTISVSAGGFTYTQNAQQFGGGPVFTAPSVGDEWPNGITNQMRWTMPPGLAPSGFLVGVVDLDKGVVDWPISGNYQEVGPTDRSADVYVNTLSAGRHVALVGALVRQPWLDAAIGSTLSVVSFVDSPLFQVVARDFNARSLSFLQTHSAVEVGKQSFIPLEAWTTDGRLVDARAAAEYTVADPTKVAIDAHGRMTGLARGRTTVRARIGAQTAEISVFSMLPSSWPDYSRLSTAYQADGAHSGTVVSPATPPVFPPSSGWSTPLDSTPDYPLVAEGRVFTTTATGSLYGLSLATGTVEWGPIVHPAGVTGATYGGSRVYVATRTGQVLAYNAASGALAWSVALPGESLLLSPPVAYKGIVYASGAGSDTVFALDAYDGELLWKNPGAGGSPIVTEGSVLLTHPCGTRSFRSLEGLGGPVGPAATCAGGRGHTAARGPRYLFTFDVPPDLPPVSGQPQNLIDIRYYDFKKGFDSTTLPAMGAYLEIYARAGSELRSINDFNLPQVKWRFTGDGTLTTPPLALGDTVFIGASSGKVYAVDGPSGALRWSEDAGDVIPAHIAGDETRLRGLAAGEGWIVVPTNGSLRAWKVFP